MCWAQICVGKQQVARRLSVTASMSTNAGPEAAANNPGYCGSPDAATKSYYVQQTVSTNCCIGSIQKFHSVMAGAYAGAEWIDGQSHPHLE